MGSSQTREGTHVLCIGSRILNPWTTSVVLLPLSFECFGFAPMNPLKLLSSTSPVTSRMLNQWFSASCYFSYHLHFAQWLTPSSLIYLLPLASGIPPSLGFPCIDTSLITGASVYLKHLNNIVFQCLNTGPLLFCVYLHLQVFHSKFNSEFYIYLPRHLYLFV